MNRNTTLRASLVALVLGLGMAFAACSGDAPVITVKPSGTPIPDGVTPFTFAVDIKVNGEPVSNDDSPALALATDFGQFDIYPLDENGKPTGNDVTSLQTATGTLALGQTTFKMYAKSPGTSTVLAKYTDGNGRTGEKRFTVTWARVGAPDAGPRPDAGPDGGILGVGGVTYVGAIPGENIQIAGSGENTSTELTFRVVDVNGQPSPNDVAVVFELSDNNGGASLLPTTAKTAGDNGLVKTSLAAGSLAASIKVTARAGNQSGESRPIVVTGRGISYQSLDFACDKYSIGALEKTGLRVRCTVYAGDFDGKFVANTQVNILREAGTVPRQVVIAPTGGDDGLGSGSFDYQGTCPDPFDVRPKAGEFSDSNCSFTSQCSATPTRRTCNPRDGIAGLVVYTTGEECFRDGNGNGQFDNGEEDLVRCDLGEPYIDANDNGQYDGPGVDADFPTGEPFADVDGNNVWTAPNGRWDRNGAIWKAVKITWTGLPSRFGAESQSPASFVNMACGSSGRVTYYWADFNGNIPTADGSGDYAALACNGRCSVDTPSSKDLSSDVSAYGRAANGLPTISFTFRDTQTECPPTTPVAGEFSLGLTSQRSLDTQTGESSTYNRSASGAGNFRP